MKTRSKIVMLVLVCLTVMLVNAAEEGTQKDANEPQIVAQATTAKAEIFKTEVEKVSYIIGTQIAGNFKTQEIEVNLDSLLLGLKDALEGKELALSQDEMKQVFKRFQQQMRAKQAAKQAKEAAENMAAGTTFLEANKAKEGVKVLPSGLQYKVVTEGTGNTPVATDRVKTHYRGSFVGGKVFQSSFEGGKPIEFGVTGVIPGWTEALKLMKEGAKWELYIPANLAYGERGKSPSIPANSTLIFEIELLEIVKADPADKAKAAQPTIKVQ